MSLLDADAVDAFDIRLARRAGKLWLQPANNRYQPIPVEGDTKVLGKVIGVIRSYERKF